MPDKRAHWEKRYSAPDRAIGRPSEFFQSVLPQSAPPDVAGGRALDVACGDGRHAIALAEKGYAVDAIDLSYAGLARLRDRARDKKLQIEAIQADLECWKLSEDRYDVVVDTFYLQRDLFPAIKRSLIPGGLAIVETFLIDQREIGRPSNPAFLLGRGELRDRFSDFEIVACEEGLFGTGDERAYLSRLAARRPRR